MRALGALLRASTAGDLHRVYTLCQMQGMDFNLAYVPDDHRSKAKELFDQPEMAALFELGFQKAQTGTAWTKSLPERGPDTRPAK
ncbi:MAG: hypothetical protein NTV86_22130 [Planctomycetota bacterium]|nr:hypothetical protein [Planctomycetota bacterium]